MVKKHKKKTLMKQLTLNDVVMLHSRGDFSNAEAGYRAIIQQDQRSAIAYSNLAAICLGSSRVEEAIQLLKKAIAIKPDYAEAYNNLANAYQSQGLLDMAMDSYLRAIEIKADFVDAHNNLGNLFQSLGDSEKAIIQYQKAIQIRPDCAAAYKNLGYVYNELNQYDEAIKQYEIAIALNPNFAEAYNNLGIVYSELCLFDKAISQYKMAIQKKPDFARAHNNLAIIYKEQGLFEEACNQYQIAIQSAPNFIEAYNNLANLYRDLGQLDKAISQYQKVLQQDKNYRHALGQYWHLRQHCCDWAEQAKMYQQLEENIPLDLGKTEGHAAPPLTLIAVWDKPELLQREAQKYIALKCKNITAIQHDDKHWPKKDSIKVAYLSADFHNHATAYLMAEIFELHRNSPIEAHAFSFGPQQDSAMRRRLTDAFFAFHEVGHLSDKAIAEKIASLHIDIVVDLKGYTRDSRTKILAYRPAPIQVNFLGYPGTMGADFIDYIIADPYLIPVEELQYYTEKIVYMPDSYQPNDRKRLIAKEKPSRKDCGLPEQGFVFCSFNQSYKITPEVFAIWMRLLLKIENSVLWLFETNPWATENLQREAKLRGVDPARLVFASPLSLDKHLSRMQLADLFLDTFPCNAHTTASDALWAGVPVLTCSGRSFASRVAGSLLTAIGMPELISNNFKAYEALAEELAKKPEELKAIKERLIQNRMTRPLFDSERFLKNLCQAYVLMLQRLEAGKKPESFYVGDSPIAIVTKHAQKTREIPLSDPHAYLHQGNILKSEGKLDEAILAFQKAIQIKPDFAEAFNNLATVLQSMGHIEKAINLYRKAIELKADFYGAYFNLANILQEQGKLEEAMDAYNRAIQINADFFDAYYNLAILLQAKGSLDKAIQYYQRAFQLDQKQGKALVQYWHLRQQICDWKDDYTLKEQIEAYLSQPETNQYPLTPFPLVAMLDRPDLQRRAASNYINAKMINFRPVQSIAQNRRQQRDRIKVAYLSADFHEHATAYLMAEIFELHRNSNIETHAFSFGPAENSAMRLRLKKAFHHFHEVGSWTDRAIAEAIAKERIDIAIDLKGYTKNTRPLILAYRPAPIQVNFLGYPGSVGADFIDYILADPYIIPVKEQIHYSEKIVYLPDSYQPNDRTRLIAKEPLSRTDCGLPEKAFVFCSLNQTYKISPEVFAIWMRLLKKTKASVLWLLESNSFAKKNLQQEAERLGVDSSRLVFAGTLPMAKHLQRMQLADLFLDTFPCNAHTTASDALWVGLPIVTCSGRSFASRVAGSLLTAIGLPLLITNNFKDYEALAAKLAANPKKLKAIRTQLEKNRLSTALFDSERFEKNLRLAFMKMIERLEALQKPESFYVEPKKDNCN